MQLFLCNFVFCELFKKLGFGGKVGWSDVPRATNDELAPALPRVSEPHHMSSTLIP